MLWFQETNIHGVIVGVDSTGTFVDVEYVEPAAEEQDLPTEKVDISTLSPLQRSTMQRGMTLQRQVKYFQLSQT